MRRRGLLALAVLLALGVSAAAWARVGGGETFGRGGGGSSGDGGSGGGGAEILFLLIRLVIEVPIIGCRC
ncbi:MAG: hypothetical protein R3F59_12580 [Myxococcota bacterium]